MQSMSARDRRVNQRTSLAKTKDGLFVERRRWKRCEAVVAGPVVASVAATDAPQDGDVRMDLVASLRERIAAGSYRVDAAEIAEKMMARMLK